MKKILGIGNALVDVIVFLRDDDLLQSLSLPKGSMQLVDERLSESINEVTHDLDRHYASGGSAANTIHGLAKLGIKTGYVGTVGNDELGRFFREDLENSGIEAHLHTDALHTGVAISLVSKNGERTFATHLGAALELKTDFLDKDLFSLYDHLHLEGYLVQNHSLLLQSLRLAKTLNMSVSLDMASYNVVEENRDFLADSIRDYIDIVFANEEEASVFTLVEDPEKALVRIADICDTAVVKTGEKGSLVMEGGKKYRVESIAANCMDTTGAGDLYASGFIYGMIHQFNPAECGRIGSLLAGKVIEEAGAKIGEKGWNAIYHALNIRP